MIKSLSFNVFSHKNNYLFNYVDTNNIIGVKQDIFRGENIHILNEENQNLIHIAAKKGYLSLVKLLIQCELNYNQIDKHGDTPLTLAIKNGKNEVMDYLLSLSSSSTLLPIHNAIITGNLNLFKLLYDNIEIVDKEMNTPLHCAVKEDQLEIVKFLIEEKSVNINRKNVWNITPLEQAVISNKRRIADYLRDHGAFYRIHLDSEQIIIGERRLFFEKIAIIIDILTVYFPSYQLIQLFNTTYTSTHLLCCSIHTVSDEEISNDLYKATSTLIFDHDYHMFKNEYNVFNTCKSIKQSNFFLSVYCRNYNCNSLATIPFMYKNKSLGSFVVWNKTDVENIALTYNFKNLIEYVIDLDYNNVLSISGKIFLKCIKHQSVMKYLYTLLNEVYKRDSYHFYMPNNEIVSLLWKLENDWLQLSSNDLFNNLVMAVVYQLEMNIPVKPSISIINLNSPLVKKLRKIKDYPSLIESVVFVELRKFAKEISKISLIQDTLNVLPMKKITQSELYDIIGNHSYNHHIINNLNTMIKETDFFSTSGILELAKILIHKSTFRESNVVGVVQGNQYCLFIHHLELEKAMNFVLTQCLELNANPIKQIYFYFSAMVEYIHPFTDGNGRVFRVIMNLMLRKIGINKTITKKILPFKEFEEIVSR